MANSDEAANFERPQLCPTCGSTIMPDGDCCPSCGSPTDIPTRRIEAAIGNDDASPGLVTVPCLGCGMEGQAGSQDCSSCALPLDPALGEGIVIQLERISPSTATPLAGECSVCGGAIPAGQKNCPRCAEPGAATMTADGNNQPTLPACPSCGLAPRRRSKICPWCGTPSPPSRGKLRPGQLLAHRYRVVEVIGGGGMATVFRGLDTHLTSSRELQGRQVAIKAIIGTDPELLAAAVDEREILVRLDHPGIVRIYDVVHEGDTPYIIMALVKGTTWKDLKHQNGGSPLSESQALRLLLGVRGAIEYLHGRTPPVVHRDIKNGNLMSIVEPDGAIHQVIIDLGTAVEYVPGQQRQTWGTEGFVPPEIRAVCEQAPAMDLWAIASTLAELLGVDVAEYQAGAPPREDWPVSQEVYDFVCRGRHIDPQERFQSAGEVFDQLSGIARFVEGRQQTYYTGNIALLPVQSTLITGKLCTGDGRIGALPAPSSMDPASLFLEPVRELIDEGRYAEAIEQLGVVLKAHPTSGDSYLLQAAACSNLGRAAEAQDALTRATDLSTPAARWRILLVQAQLAATQEDFVTAESLYQQLIELLPGEVPPRHMLANLYQKIGRHDEAAALYERVVCADPANADAVLGWADSLVALGDTDRAIEVLDMVQENALRYFDAELHLIELYLTRVASYLDRRGAVLSMSTVPDAGARAVLVDLDLAGRSIAALTERGESRRLDRLQGDWWYTAYQLARAGLLWVDITWPDNAAHANTSAHVGRAARTAYRCYLDRAPGTADRKEVIARICFEIEEWQ